MKHFEFHLNISAEKYLDYYRGVARQVSVRCPDAQTVIFPASLLKRFITTTVIQGDFILTCDENIKIADLQRLPHLLNVVHIAARHRHDLGRCHGIFPLLSIYLKPSPIFSPFLFRDTMNSGNCHELPRRSPSFSSQVDYLLLAGKRFHSGVLGTKNHDARVVIY